MDSFFEVAVKVVRNLPEHTLSVLVAHGLMSLTQSIFQWLSG